MRLVCADQAEERANILSKKSVFLRSIRENPCPMLNARLLSVVLRDSMRSSSLLLTLPAALVLILPELRMPENAAVPQNPTSEAARQFQLGESHRKAGRLEQAEAHYEAALRLDPGFVSAYRYLGETLLRRGQGARAAAVVEKALALERENVDLLIFGGVAYGTAALLK